MLRQCASLQLLLAGGASLATASPRYDPGFFDGNPSDCTSTSMLQPPAEVQLQVAIHCHSHL